jgi:hypothetical protein
MKKTLLSLIFTICIIITGVSQVTIKDQITRFSPANYIDHWDVVNGEYISVGARGLIHVYSDEFSMTRKFDIKDIIDQKRFYFINAIINEDEKMVFVYAIYNKKKSNATFFAAKLNLQSGEVTDQKEVFTTYVLYRSQLYQAKIIQSPDKSKVALHYAFYDESVTTEMMAYKTREGTEAEYKVLFLDNKMAAISEPIRYCEDFKIKSSEKTEYLDNNGVFYNLCIDKKNKSSIEEDLIKSFEELNDVTLTFEKVENDDVESIEIDVEGYISSSFSIRENLEVSFSMVSVKTYETPFVFEVFNVDFGDKKLKNVQRQVSSQNTNYKMRDFSEKNNGYAHRFGQFKIFESKSGYRFQFRECLYEVIPGTETISDNKMVINYKKAYFGDVNVMEVNQTSFDAVEFSVQSFEKINSNDMYYYKINYFPGKIEISSQPMELLMFDAKPDDALEVRIYGEDHKVKSKDLIEEKKGNYYLKILPTCEDFQHSYIIKEFHEMSNLSRVFYLGNNEFICFYYYNNKRYNLKFTLDFLQD